MKRRLFLTGPIGCGKSTAIAQALGDRLFQCGGFLTRRYRKPFLHFSLESPNGSSKETFLDFSSGKPVLDLTVFSRVSLQGNVLVLDEIGGIELLNPEFASTLEDILCSDVPVLGVLKGEGPAGSLIRTLDLTETYQQAADKLRRRLYSDPDTMIYKCGQFDDYACLLAEQWTEEYFHG